MSQLIITHADCPAIKTGQHTTPTRGVRNVCSQNRCRRRKLNLPDSATQGVSTYECNSSKCLKQHRHVGVYRKSPVCVRETLGSIDNASTIVNGITFQTATMLTDDTTTTQIMLTSSGPSTCPTTRSTYHIVAINRPRDKTKMRLQYM